MSKIVIQNIHGPKTSTTIVMNEVAAVIRLESAVVLQMKSGREIRHEADGKDGVQRLYDALCASLGKVEA